MEACLCCWGRSVGSETQQELQQIDHRLEKNNLTIIEINAEGRKDIFYRSGQISLKGTGSHFCQPGSSQEVWKSVAVHHDDKCQGESELHHREKKKTFPKRSKVSSPILLFKHSVGDVSAAWQSSHLTIRTEPGRPCVPTCWKNTTVLMWKQVKSTVSNASLAEI